MSLIESLAPTSSTSIHLDSDGTTSTSDENTEDTVGSQTDSTEYISGEADDTLTEKNSNNNNVLSSRDDLSAASTKASAGSRKSDTSTRRSDTSTRRSDSSIRRSEVNSVTSEAGSFRSEASSVRSVVKPNGWAHDDVLSANDDESNSSDGQMNELELIKQQIRNLETSLETERGCVVELRKKLIKTSSEKLGETRQFNEEMTLVRCQYTTLEAKLEEQVAHNEQLEYELVKTKKQLKTDHGHSTQREEQDEKTILQLRDRLKEYQTEVTTLEESLTTTKRSLSADKHSLQLELSDKQSIINQYQSDIEINKSEQIKLKQFINEQETSLNELLQKTKSLESELSQAKSELSKVQGQSSELEQNNKLQHAKLEKLESHCNDLTAALNSEREAVEQLTLNNDDLEKRNVELDYLLSEELQKSQTLRQQHEEAAYTLQELEDKYTNLSTEVAETSCKLTKCESELEITGEQLKTEQSQKLQLDQCLREQIKVHQANITDLKEELAEYRKQQDVISLTSSAIIEELKTVLPVSGADNSSSTDPRSTIERLHQTITVYKNRCTNLTAERDNSRAQLDSLNKELKSYKENLWSKEKQHKELEKKLNNLKRELGKLRSEESEVQAKCATLTVDLETSKQLNNAQQTQVQKLSTEITQLRHSVEEDKSERLSSLRRVYRQLISATSRNDDLEQLDWNQLVSIISERTIQIHNELSELRDRLIQQEDIIDRSEASLNELRQEHSDRVSELELNMSCNIDRANNQWKREKDRLEEHYQQIMSENLNRQQIYKEQMEKSQRAADQAWNQFHQSDERVQQVETTKQSLVNELDTLTIQNKSLLCSLALLSGLYFPLLCRNNLLITQKRILLKQYNRFEELKTKISSLLETLMNSDKSTPDTSPSIRPCLRFRRAVITVMVCLRLKRLASQKCNSIIIPDSERTQSHVCWISSTQGSDLDDERGVLTNWLTQTDLVSVSTMCSQDILSAINNHQKGIHNSNMRTLVRGSIMKLTRQLQSLYGSLPQLESSAPICRALQYGLQSYITSSNVQNLPTGLSTKEVITQLQEKVLSFVNLLHNSETERLNLKMKIKNLTSASDDLRITQNDLIELTRSHEQLQHQMNAMVDKSKVDQVLSELDLALERERQAQSLLSDQSQQLKELTMRLQTELNGKSSTENSVKNALKALHSELDKKTDEINKLAPRLQILEREKTTLINKLQDVETALKTAADDRNQISDYVNDVNQTLQQNRYSGGRLNTNITRILSSDDYLPSYKSSALLTQVQGLICHMSSSLDLTSRESESLKDQITSYESHINKLKRELQLVCSEQKTSDQYTPYRPLQPAQSYSGSPKIYIEPSKNYSEQPKHYSEQPKHHSEPSRNYSEPPKNYSKAQRDYSEAPSRKYTEKTNSYKSDRYTTDVASCSRGLADNGFSPRNYDTETEIYEPHKRIPISPRDNARSIRHTLKHNKMIKSAGNERH